MLSSILLKFKPMVFRASDVFLDIIFLAWRFDRAFKFCRCCSCWMDLRFGWPKIAASTASPCFVPRHRRCSHILALKASAKGIPRGIFNDPWYYPASSSDRSSISIDLLHNLVGLFCAKVLQKWVDGDDRLSADFERRSKKTGFANASKIIRQSQCHRHAA